MNLLFHCILVIGYDFKRHDITLSHGSYTCILQLKASSSHFHAHICLELHKYIEIFWKTNYKQLNFKPTKNWEIIEKSSKPANLYVRNVLNYKLSQLKKTKDYQNQDIVRLKNFETKSKYLLPFSHQSLINIEFEDDRPIVKFKLKAPQQSEQKILLEAMVNFADKNGYFVKNSGCHICLNIKDSILNAYLLVSGTDYAKIHPSPATFLNEYKNNFEFNIET